MPEEHKIVPGDIVQLKSGGSRMTVFKEDGTDEVWCEWENKKGEQQRGKFYRISLDWIDPSKSPI